jgi:uncharacterized membrane protein YphA (DoxX/SURF4 family)
MLIRAAVASVWLYEGLWCKALRHAPKQAEMVEAIPLLSRRANWFLPALGYAECLMGVWLLTGWQAPWSALASTLLLIGLISVGLTFARRQFPDPPGMVLRSLVLVVLTWVAAAPFGR